MSTTDEKQQSSKPQAESTQQNQDLGNEIAVENKEASKHESSNQVMSKQNQPQLEEQAVAVENKELLNNQS